MIVRKNQDNETIVFKLDDMVICFDSNVWLDLYKLPPISIEHVVNAILNNINHFWLPNQVYIEFNRHLKKNRDFALDRYKNIIKVSCQLLNNTQSQISQEFVNLRNSHILDANELHSIFESEISKLQSNLKMGLQQLDHEYQKEVKCISKEEDIVVKLIERLYKLREDKIFSINELIAIYEEGETRYKYNVPPGFTDEKKNNREDLDHFLSRKYGDLIIWKEILRYMRDKNKNLLFVQNEKKSDWWESYSSKKIATVLKQEYEEATNSSSELLMMDFVDFLSLAGKKLGMQAETIEEIVLKSKLEKAVCNYLNTNRSAIIEDYLERVYLEKNKLYDLLSDYSFFGGSVEDVETYEILEINILESDVVIDKDWEINYMSFTLEVEFDTYISEYINRYVCHSGKVTIKCRLGAEIDFSINYQDLKVEPSQAYTITGSNVYDEEFISHESDGYNVDVDIDEDMFRDR